MDCKTVKKTFRVVGIKGSGAFSNFGTEIPKLAQQFLNRLDEIDKHSGTEIALFEPKRDAGHLEGYYYVGVMVNEPTAPSRVYCALRKENFFLIVTTSRPLTSTKNFGKY